MRGTAPPSRGTSSRHASHTIAAEAFDTVARVSVIEERQFHARAVAVNYAQLGTGVPIVLLHGGSSRWQSLEELVHGLADLGCVRAPDLRGHGLSGHLPGRYRLSDYADDLVEFLGSCTGPARVFGHSLGGQVAIVAASQRPDLFQALAIGDAPIALPSHRRRTLRDRPMLSVWRDLSASGRSRAEIAHALRDLWVPDLEGRSGRAGDLIPASSPWFEFMAGCLGDLDPTMLDAVLEFDEMYAAYDADRLLPAISCPVLLVRSDPAYGSGLSEEDLALAEGLLRDARAVRIAQAGHAGYVGKITGDLREFFA